MKSSWMMTVPREPISSSTTPFQASRPASVTTNDGTPTLAMIGPWRIPIAMPDESADDRRRGVANSLPSGQRQEPMITRHAR